MTAHEDLVNRLASNLRVSHGRATTALQVSASVLSPTIRLISDRPELWLRLF